MSRARFEQLIEKAKGDLAEAMFNLTAGDAMNHALIKGKRIGLEKALELYKESVRAEHPEDKL